MDEMMSHPPFLVVVGARSSRRARARTRPVRDLGLDVTRPPLGRVVIGTRPDVAVSPRFEDARERGERKNKEK